MAEKQAAHYYLVDPESVQEEEAFDQTFQQMFEEMRWPHFRGFWILLTVWGEKQT